MIESGCCRWFKDGAELKPGDVYQLSGSRSLFSSVLPSAKVNWTLLDPLAPTPALLETAWERLSALQPSRSNTSLSSKLSSFVLPSSPWLPLPSPSINNAAGGGHWREVPRISRRASLPRSSPGSLVAAQLDLLRILIHLPFFPLQDASVKIGDKHRFSVQVLKCFSHCRLPFATQSEDTL